MIFARTWGVVAILFGFFIVFIAVHDIFEFQTFAEKIDIKGLIFVSGVGFVLLGRFFLTMKINYS